MSLWASRVRIPPRHLFVYAKGKARIAPTGPGESRRGTKPGIRSAGLFFLDHVMSDKNNSSIQQSDPVVGLGNVEFYRRGQTISVNNRLITLISQHDKEDIAESLRSLADMISLCGDARERTDLRKAAIGWKWEAERSLREYQKVRHELAELRAGLAGDLWMWQGDGNDYIESLTGSVVISAADLAAIIHGRKSAECPTKEDWRVVVVAPASDETDELFYSLFGTQERATKIYSHLTRAGVDCWIESPSREKSTPPIV